MRSTVEQTKDHVVVRVLVVRETLFQVIRGALCQSEVRGYRKANVCGKLPCLTMASNKVFNF